MNYTALLKAINTATAQLQGRAKYGERLLDTLARDLAKSELRGFTAAVLRSCRLTYQIYPQIRQTLSVESDAPLEQSLLSKSRKRNSGDSVPRIPVTLSPETAAFTRPDTN